MKYTIKDYPEIKKRVDNMSFEELLKSVICPHICFHNGETPVYDTPAQLFHPLKFDKAKKMTAEVLEKQPDMLIVSDFEAGAGGMIIGATRFPSLMACGVTDDDDLAYKMGEVCAGEARAAGYSWTFAPCVDITLNHDCPIVSTRSAGDTAERVIKIGGAYMRGLQDNGLIATLKHFPGDGACKYDQHLTTAENPLSMDEWNETYGKIYAELIEQGVKAIMPGHISLPSYDTVDEKLGICPPATLSKKLLTDLLKGQLGFDGIIVSDAVNMGGFCGFMNYYDACCTFLEAGGDCLLFAGFNDNFVAGMRAGIEKGILSTDTLKNRAYRMLCFAHEYSESEKPHTEISREYAEEIARRVVNKSCLVVRDRDGILPYNIKKDTKIMHLVVQNNYDNADISRLTEELKKYSDTVDECCDPGPDLIFETVESGKYDLIVCTIGCQRAYGFNTTRLHGNVARNMMMGWTKLGTPIVFVNYGHAYLEEEYKASIDTLINTYGCTDYTAEAVVNTIIGK